MFIYFIAGVASAGRIIVGINYMNEFVPIKYQNISCTWFPNGDSFVMIYQAIFYMYVPNWYYDHSVAILFGCFLLYLNYQLPESPKYLYVNKRFDETREILKIVAKNNRADITDHEIDSFVFELEGGDENEEKESTNLNYSK